MSDAKDMKSTQAMRDRIRELMSRERDDYDRAVECVLDDLEAALRSPSPSVPEREAIARIIDPGPFTALDRQTIPVAKDEEVRMTIARQKADAILALAHPDKRAGEDK